MTQKRRKLNPEQIAQLRKEYEALQLWDPEATDSIDKLLERWEIAKPTLYRYRERWLADDEMRRLEEARLKAAERDVDKALAHLAMELAAARMENERLRSQLEKPQADANK